MTLLYLTADKVGLETGGGEESGEGWDSTKGNEGN